jgi:hypothetical protein
MSNQFFDKLESPESVMPNHNPDRVLHMAESSSLYLKPHKSETDSSSSSRRKEAYKRRSLGDIIGVETGGPQGRRKDDPGHTPQMYELFVDFIR